MPKVRKVYVCRSCGGAQSRWLGKCPDCGAWDSLDEEIVDPSAARDPQKGLVAGWSELQEGEDAGAAPGPKARPLSEVDDATPPPARLTSGIAELDRVLGGGLVKGSAVLFGGEPGIGKSTLLLQAAGAWAGQPSTRVLYATSEESVQQVRLRAQRLGQAGEGAQRLYLLADNNLARIIEQARQVRPDVLVVDSIQLVYKSDLPASPGSVTQLRRCCAELVYLAKASGIAVVLVGHVTKEGELAGPRLLEHLVDAVVYFEGERYHSHRVVRATKNRFGTTLEIGIFEMTGSGLREVGAGATLADPASRGSPGSVVCPVVTGSRCVLAEIQALTATGFLGAAKRKCSGLDASRLAMLIAVLEQHAGQRLADRDVFASSVGGWRIVEPASDLALLLAIAGAHLRRGLSRGTAAVGEVGLGGEVRAVPQLEQRVRECQRLGFSRVLVPKGSRAEVGGATLLPVATIDQAIAQLDEVPRTS